MPENVPTFTVYELENQPILDVTSFSNDDAVDLGLIGIEVITEWDVSLAVDVVLEGDLVFRAKLKQTGRDNDPWLAGKAAVAVHFEEPSMLVRMRHIEAGTEFTDLNLDHDVMRAHGGSIPLRVSGRVVGTLTMSGEPDGIDHAAAAETIRRFLELHEE